MENVCNILPSSIKSECDDFIQEYTPEIIKLLEEKLQPESLCKQIGLCSSVKVNKSLFNAFDVNITFNKNCKSYVQENFLFKFN